MRTLKKVLVLVVSALVTVLAAEIAYRVKLSSGGRGYDAEATAEGLRARLDPLKSMSPRGAGGGPDGGDRTAQLLHPFWGAERNHDPGGVLAFFRAGVPDEVYTIVVVGGSVATLWGNEGTEHLRAQLEQDPRLGGRRVRVLNFAHPSYKQPQMLFKLGYLLSMGYRPDAVINIDGFNEVALAVKNSHRNIHPIYPSYPVWGVLVESPQGLDEANLKRVVELYDLREEAQDLVDRTLGWGLHRSAIVGRRVEKRLQSLLERRFQVQQAFLQATPNEKPTTPQEMLLYRQVRGPDFDITRGKVLAAGARNWFESSHSMHVLCESRGIQYLHVLQPTLYDHGSKPLSAAEKALPPGPAGWEEGASKGYPLLRDLGPELVNRGVSFLDATMVFEDVTDDLYFDTCHFNQKGNWILGRTIAEAFLADLRTE